MNDTEAVQPYHLISKIIHWITALIFCGLLFVGFYMTGLPFSEDKFAIYALHKSFGLLILLLVSVRVLIHVFIKKPKPLETHKPWEKVLSKIAHMFLYFAMFALPVSGWVMSSAGDFTIAFFGIDVPDIVEKDEEVFGNAREAHEIIALIVIGVIGVHILGALKHHFIDRDATLQRMTLARLGLIGGVLVTLFAGVIYAPALYMVSDEVLHELYEGDHEAVVVDDLVVEDEGTFETPVILRDTQKWQIVPDHSAIKFSVTQYGQPFEGAFQLFSGDIFFDPADLDNSYARIVIDISSIITGSDDRDAQAKSSEWFDVSVYPKGVFESESFEYIQGGEYKVSGYLTLRDVRLPLSFPFILELENNGDDGRQTAHMSATFTLQRLDFGVGQGQWQKTDAIGNNVDLSVDVLARAAGH
ncbi:MAG: YceI family protein [Alphaproteobacteria bacterium]